LWITNNCKCRIYLMRYEAKSRRYTEGSENTHSFCAVSAKQRKHRNSQFALSARSAGWQQQIFL
jgi:hypothetical protein